MRHHLVCFASCISIYVAAAGGCTPTDRNFDSTGGTGGGGMTASSSSSSSGTAGEGGSGLCPPSTGDCNKDGTCETNLLGDVDHCGACDTPCIAPMGSSVSCVGGKCEYSCDPGTLDCDQDPSTACQDVLSDAKHCGACGHDCLGGMCMQGECSPTLAFMSGNVTNNPPVSLAVLGSEIFWGTLTNEVAKANLDGSGAMLLGLVGGGGGMGVYGLAVTNQGVYATSGTRVTSFNLSGGMMWGSVNDNGVNNVAANDLYVVWTTTGNNRVRYSNAVGGGGGGKDVGGGLEMGPTSVVLEGNMVRWVNTGSGEIRESLVENGVAQTIFMGPAGSRLLVQDKNVFYWVANETIYRGIPGNAPEALFPTGPDVRALVVDQDHLYWTLGNAGEIRRASKMAPYDPKPVVINQPEPHAMALGPDSVFWGNRGDGSIMRLAR